ncbi:hypothetical protein diail_569 [Diaporthe ilicicola]|nr:hypothetical protein diail_569 [Diaporthe ilicicola]
MQSILPTNTATTFILVMLAVVSNNHVSAMDSKGCYNSGIKWDELGTWDEIDEALRTNPIFNLTAIGNDTETAKSKIQIKDHCFILDFDGYWGHTDMGHEAVTTALQMVYDSCDHGGQLKP